MDFNFLIWFCYGTFVSAVGEGGVGEGTMALFFTILQWSLFWLWLGLHPDKDWTGRLYTRDDPEFKLKLTDLADGFYGLLWAIRMDLDGFATYLDLPFSNERTGARVGYFIKGGAWCCCLTPTALHLHFTFNLYS